MRHSPSIPGVEFQKRFFRANVTVRASTREQGSPSPSQSFAQPEISSQSAMRIGIERRFDAEFDQPVIITPPGNSRRYISSPVKSLSMCIAWKAVFMRCLMKRFAVVSVVWKSPIGQGSWQM